VFTLIDSFDVNEMDSTKVNVLKVIDASLKSKSAYPTLPPQLPSQVPVELAIYQTQASGSPVKLGTYSGNNLELVVPAGIKATYDQFSDSAPVVARFTWVGYDGLDPLIAGKLPVFKHIVSGAELALINARSNKQLLRDVDLTFDQLNIGYTSIIFPPASEIKNPGIAYVGIHANLVVNAIQTIEAQAGADVPKIG
jgi:hypothetical protein